MNRYLLCLFSCVIGVLAPSFAAPPPPPGANVSLFDGSTLAGWEGNTQLWRVQDGALTGGSLTETVKHNDFLATVKDYGNFIVRFKIKLTGAGGFVNSGFQIRSERVPNNSEMRGYQCDFGDPNWWGAIYDESRRNKVLSPSDMKALEPVLRRNDWNDYVIRADGPRITTWINGVQATDYTEPDASIPRTGKLGIQVHGGGKALVQVKEITIEELPVTEPGAKPAAASPVKEGPSGAKTPQEELATFKLPDGFEAELVAAEDPANGIGKFVPIAFDQRGALWTTTALEYPVDGNENPAAADALYASKAKDKVLVYDRDPSQPTGYSPKPRVFAEGLAIPLGVLPYKNGCYVQHGHDIAFLEDTDSDGKADKRTVILTGFGVQDSHLFPHQFMRAPGGWIWMAQGAFNYSKVRRPDEPAEKAVKFDQTRMAKFRPDGSGFDITSNGPCNIWGLVLNGEGEAFIQEANDFGYPVMPFHEYANYPGCSDAQWKSYAPEFPGTAPDFRMGGTGLSGLAILDKAWAAFLRRNIGVPPVRPAGFQPTAPASPGETPAVHTAGTTVSQTVLVANPITNRIQAIVMHRDGSRWRMDKPTDFLVSTDPWFRPVAITVGPDGCLYIIDWYNQIISHNEVPRNHPDRDKTRGRIWRVKAKVVKPFDVPDFTKLSGDELIAKLGGDSLAQSHLAWQAIADRGMKELVPELEKMVFAPLGRRDLPKDIATPAPPEYRRIAALWARRSLGDFRPNSLLEMLAVQHPSRNVRREAVAALPTPPPPSWELLRLQQDPDSEVRAEMIRKLGHSMPENQGSLDAIRDLLFWVHAPLAEPLAPSTKNSKPIKIREAYDREFERYLVRMFLERQPDAVAKFLESEDANRLPVEARLLATLALEPKASASRVAKLLPRLQRAPGQEEVLRLAQFPDEPGVGDALKATLQNSATRTATLEALLAVRTRLDAAKLTPFLTDAARQLLKGDDAAAELGVRLVSGFRMGAVEPELVLITRGANAHPKRTVAA
ncbi:MAG TPA: PVC-type heme-binding CxxCH protein, partial [Chthoniobacteraceae bacterium]|nr:PVC-type heme-binding CxxCH protein [Chthoniobacteraceae bacterium]